jgi:aspartyl-tRNA(Asn)/glutamyl-tRNA(Gln) amidotransferase subunit C
MSLKQDEIIKISNLAKLNISDEQMGEYENRLTSILDLAEQMGSIDTTGVEPMSHPLHMIQRLREDVVTEGSQREHFQEHAPSVEKGLFVVPKVIE